MNKLLGLGLGLSLIVAFGSCKPKQSAYQSVYEAAKEKEMQENKKDGNSKPAYPTYSSNYESEPVRTEVVTPVYESDANNLRAYSVVVSSLSVKPNAEALKSRLEREGYKVILAQNAQGMYRVIVGSFDDKSSAVQERNAIRDRFLSMGSSESLRKTYGIPFNDLWILQRQY